MDGFSTVKGKSHEQVLSFGIVFSALCELEFEASQIHTLRDAGQVAKVPPNTGHMATMLNELYSAM